MRRTLLGVSLLVLASLPGCTAGERARPPLALGSAPWRDDDRATYQVFARDGSRLGTSDFTFSLDGNTWLLSQTDDLRDLAQVTIVRFDARTYTPIDAGKNIHAAGTAATVNATYGNGTLEIRPVVNGASDVLTIGLPPGALDNDQVLMTLRALDFADGYEAGFVDVVPGRALKLDMAVRVTGPETVEVPIGTYQAWRVELISGGARQHAWYQVEPPHNLLVYDDGTQRAELSGAALFLASPPWLNGERAVYDVVDQAGSKIGTAEFRFAQEGADWSLSHTEEVPGQSQRVTVRIDGRRLRPVSSRKSLQTPGIEATYETTYRKGKVEVRAVVNGRTDTLSVAVPSDCLDADQVLMTLRALEFAAGLTGKYVQAIPERALRVTMPVRIAGRERVTVPAGTFEAWRVEVEIGTGRQYAWYQVTPPYNLVQYDRGAGKAVLVQVSRP